MLFDFALIPGLTTQNDLVTPADEADLIARITALDLTPFRFRGFAGKRLTASFGWAYDFERGRIAPTDPIPRWLDPLRRRAAAFACLPADALVQALLIRYDPGAGIRWHRDRSVFDQIVGVSLGAPAVLAFRRRTATGFRRVKLAVPPRGAYHLAGEARRDWQHGIAAHDALRFSITFRTLADR